MWAEDQLYKLIQYQSLVLARGNKDSQAAYFGFYLFFMPVGKEAPNPISGQCWSRKLFTCSELQVNKIF